MITSSAGLDLIKKSEGFRPKPYLDIAGIPTCGYGHKIREGEVFDELTELAAQNLLAGDVTFAEHVVSNLVHVPLTQGQFDALVDFTFNLGAARLASSTLLKELNEGNYNAAATQLMLWDHGRVDGKEVELSALKARRQAEYALWHTAA